MQVCQRVTAIQLNAAPDFLTGTPQRNMELKNLRRFHAGSVIGPSVKREKSTDPPPAPGLFYSPRSSGFSSPPGTTSVPIGNARPCVAYDTMARRSEVVAMDVEDISFLDDGTGRVIIRRSKTDQTGEGSLAYLSPDKVRYVNAWLPVSDITQGAVFRRLIGRGRIGARLQVDAIAQTFKRVAEIVGMTEEDMRQVSGHSIRVGETQDILALNIDLASVMQAGRWKTTVMPMRYGEQVQAGRGGMARVATAQGRS